MKIGIVLRMKDLMKESGEAIIKKVLFSHGIKIREIKQLDYTWSIDDFTEYLFYHSERVPGLLDIFIEGDAILKTSDYENKEDELTDEIENCIYRNDYIDDMSTDIIMFMEVE